MSDKPKDDDWGMTMPHMRFEKEGKAEDYSDDFAPNQYSANKPPADDWGATQPNFNLPNNQSAASDFDKTTPNINIPREAWQDEGPWVSPPQMPGDDWGMTQPNLNLPREPQNPNDWGADAPNRHVSPENKAEDWGMTVPNLNIPQAERKDEWAAPTPGINVPPPEKKDEWSMPTPVFRKSDGEKIDNLPKRTAVFNQNDLIGFDKTAPHFNFSEASSPGTYGAPPAPGPAKSAPPNVSETPVNRIAQETAQAESSGGSKMIYALFSLIAVLFFGIVALAGIYFLYLNKPQTASVAEPLKEESKETITSSVPTAAPIVAAPAAAATDLPKQIDYKGAMVLVAAGEFTMGSDAGEEDAKPAHKITLPAFYIDKTEVTNAEYKKFCDQTGKSYPPDPHLEKNYFTSRPNAPVVGVSFADAQAYAAWAGKRLPTEAEWEKAASWDAAAQTKRQFPWGSDFQKSSVAYNLDAISDVGKYSGGASPSGALDMAGNVLEWVDAFFQPYPNSRSKNAEFGEKNRVVRGGHFRSKTNDSLKTTKRIYVSPDIASGEDDEKLVAAIIGFRCAAAADDAKVREVLNSQSK